MSSRGTGYSISSRIGCERRKRPKSSWTVGNAQPAENVFFHHLGDSLDSGSAGSPNLKIRKETHLQRIPFLDTGISIAYFISNI
jgi:hypothetical protein